MRFANNVWIMVWALHYIRKFVKKNQKWGPLCCLNLIFHVSNLTYLPLHHKGCCRNSYLNFSHGYTGWFCKIFFDSNRSQQGPEEASLDCNDKQRTVSAFIETKKGLKGFLSDMEIRKIVDKRLLITYWLIDWFHHYH